MSSLTTSSAPLTSCPLDAPPETTSQAASDTAMNCDSIAWCYRWLERAVFGQALERARFRFPECTADATDALVLGDGDGRYLQWLLRQNPTLHADYVDLSEVMLQRARERAGSSRATYRQGNALDVTLPPQTYDLIATHFLLDCFDAAGIERLTARVRRAAAPGASWIVTEFRQPRSTWSVLPARALIGIMYRFFGMATGLKTRCLTDHRPFLLAAGFTLQREALSLGGMLASELWIAP